MSDLILLMPENIDLPWDWVLSGAPESVRGCARSDDDKAGLSALDFKRIIVVISGTLVGTKLHTLDGMSEKQQRQAVGFSIEDELAAPLADTHIAFDPNSTRLAVVAKSHMASILNALEEVGLSADIICADYDAISEDTIFAYDGRIIQTNIGGIGFSVDAGLAQHVLDDGYVELPELSSSRVLQKISESFSAGHVPINLRQGDFEKRTGFTGRRIRKLGMLAAACVFAFIGLNIGQGQNYARKNKAVQVEMRQIYGDIFPDAKMPKNPSLSVLRAQADAQMRGGESFVHLSKILALSIKQIEGVDIVSLAYDKGRGYLVLSVIYNSFDDVERLKKTVAENGGIFTENGTRQDGNRLTGNAVLRGAP